MDCPINDDANVARPILMIHARTRASNFVIGYCSTSWTMQFLFKLVLCVLLAIAAAFAYVALKSGDPLYTFYEWMSPARFHQYDRLIRSVALEHHLDPMLVKAVVWRESRFDPKKHGSHGERGLMQVSERAATEWARENKIAGFNPDQLFEPKTSLEAGTWYLHRAMAHWEHQSDPIPFALAEYNAGASRAQRWSGGNRVAEIPERQFLQKIDFPATRRYVESIIDRYRFYQSRGRM
jgi:soluble lytic murein transglycosylase